MVHENCALKSFIDSTAAFAGKSKIPSTNFALIIMLWLLGRLIVTPSVDN